MEPPSDFPEFKSIISDSVLVGPGPNQIHANLSNFTEGQFGTRTANTTKGETRFIMMEAKRETRTFLRNDYILSRTRRKIGKIRKRESIQLRNQTAVRLSMFAYTVIVIRTSMTGCLLLSAPNSTVNEIVLMTGSLKNIEQFRIVWRKQFRGYSDSYFVLTYPGGDRKSLVVSYLGPRIDNVLTTFVACVVRNHLVVKVGKTVKKTIRLDLPDKYNLLSLSLGVALNDDNMATFASSKVAAFWTNLRFLVRINRTRRRV